MSSFFRPFGSARFSLSLWFWFVRVRLLFGVCMYTGVNQCFAEGLFLVVAKGGFRTTPYYQALTFEAKVDVYFLEVSCLVAIFSPESYRILIPHVDR